MHEHIDPRVLRTTRDVTAAAREILLEQGWPAVTHVAVAERSGYARATIYRNWPTCAELVRAALLDIGHVARTEVSGDLRADVVTSLVAFAALLTDQHLGVALAALAERAPNDPEFAQMLEAATAEGSEPLRAIYHAHGVPEHEADLAVTALSGGLVYRVLFQRLPPSQHFLEQSVDFTLRSLHVP